MCTTELTGAGQKIMAKFWMVIKYRWYILRRKVFLRERERKRFQAVFEANMQQSELRSMGKPLG